MFFWKIALQILAVAIAMVINRLDYVIHDKRTRKFKMGRRLLFLLSICFLAGSIVVVIKDESAKNNEMQELTNHLNALKQQGEFAQQSIIGGDSFCYLLFAWEKGNLQSPELIIIQQGQFPVYDIGVRIADLDVFEEMIKHPYTIEDMYKSEVQIAVGNLAPHQAKTIGRLDFGKVDKKRFNVFINARNGFIQQMIRLKLINGQWKVANKVEASEMIPKDGTNDVEQRLKVLLEKIDEGFPLNNQGQVDW